MTHGLLCPECGSAVSTVYDVRPRIGGMRRRRKCENGHRFGSIEVVSSDKPRLLVGYDLKSPDLNRKKVIAAVVAVLEKRL